MATKAEKIKSMFEANKNLNVLLVCSDGCGFTEASKASAESHQATLSKGNLERITRNDFFDVKTDDDEDKAFLDYNLKTIKVKVKDIENVEELECYKSEELEKGDKARKGVVESIENRIAELVNTDNVTNEDNSSAINED